MKRRFLNFLAALLLAVGFAAPASASYLFMTGGPTVPPGRALSATTPTTLDCSFPTGRPYIDGSGVYVTEWKYVYDASTGEWKNEGTADGTPARIPGADTSKTNEPVPPPMSCYETQVYTSGKPAQINWVRTVRSASGTWAYTTVPDGTAVTGATYALPTAVVTAPTGGVLYGTGSSIGATAPGTGHQLLVGGTSPAWSGSPTLDNLTLLGQLTGIGIDLGGDVFDVRGFGAALDTTPLTGLYIKAGTATLYARTGTFSSAKFQGRIVKVAGAGTSGGLLSATATYVNPYTLTLAATASQTVVDAHGEARGTDDRAALVSAIAAARLAGGGTVRIPAGGLRVGSDLTIDHGVKLDFEEGGSIDPDPGVTVTIGADLKGTPRTQIFGFAVPWAGDTPSSRQLGRVTFSPDSGVRTFLPEWWGARHDAVDFADGTLTWSGTALISNADKFTAGMVGATIGVGRAGPEGRNLYSVIVAVADARHATLLDSATTIQTTLSFDIDTASPPDLTGNSLTDPVTSRLMVASTTGFPDKGWVVIGGSGERIYYEARGSNYFGMLSRGNPYAHAQAAGAGASVKMADTGYGAVGTDDGLAFMAAGLALSDAGGGEIAYTANYRLYKSWASDLDVPYPDVTTYFSPATDFGNGAEASPPGNYHFRNVCSFRGLNGVSMVSYGARLSIDPTREFKPLGGVGSPPTSNVVYGNVFHFSSCTNVRVEGFTVTGPARKASGLTETGGPNFLVDFRELPLCGVVFTYVTYRSSNITVKNVHAGGTAAIVWGYGYELGDPLDWPHDFHLSGLVAVNNLYTVKFNSAGDNSTVQAYSEYGHRAFMSTGISNVFLDLTVKDMYTSSVLFASYNGLGAQTVWLRYRRLSGIRSTINNHDVDFVWGDATEDPAAPGTTGTFRDIHLDTNIDWGGTAIGKLPHDNFVNASSYAMTGVFAVSMNKYSDAVHSTLDTHGMGRRVQGLTWTGAVTGTPSTDYTTRPGQSAWVAQNLRVFNMYSPRQSPSSWDEADSFSGWRFENLTIDNALPWEMYLRPLTDTVTFAGVNQPNGLVWIRDADDAGSGPGYRIVADNSNLKNLWGYTTGVQGLLGLDYAADATLQPWTSGRVVTNRLATADHTFTLPPAKRGMAETFERVANFKMTVVPTGMDTIKNGSVTLGLVGARVTLRCMADGVWENSESMGRVDFDGTWPTAFDTGDPNGYLVAWYDHGLFEGGILGTGGGSPRVDITSNGTASLNLGVGPQTRIGLPFGTNVVNFPSQVNVISGIQINSTSVITHHYSGTITWDPESVATGGFATVDFMNAGAQVGDTVACGFSRPVPAGSLLSCAVTGPGLMTATLLNMTGLTLDLLAGTLRGDAWQH